MRKTLTTLLAAALAVSSLALVSSANDEVSVQSDCQHLYTVISKTQGWEPNDYYMHSYHIRTVYRCTHCLTGYISDSTTDSGWHEPTYEVVGTTTEDGRELTLYKCAVCEGSAVG